MSKPKFPYAGDADLKRLLERYRYPAPFHVVRMRFWGDIVSRLVQAQGTDDIGECRSNPVPATIKDRVLELRNQRD